MATKKDLVEAHAFSRRRLVTAFLSGAPGGREVEPSRPGRTIVGGIALSILLIAGAAIASVLASRTPADWNKPGLILSRENAALYVILAEEDPPVLHPVINATSAQLIFGADAEATIVARETVDQQTPGATIGIFGAPQTLPTTSDLVQSGWTACTGNQLGMKVNVDRARLTTPAVPEQAQPTAEQQPSAGFVVRTVDDDKTYLIATGRLGEGGQRARYYEIPDSSLDGALTELGLPATRDALEVPSDWLLLFEPGKPLTWDSFGITDPGGPLPAASAQVVPGARVGDYIPASEGEDATVLTATGPLPLDPFSAAVYSRVVVPTTGGVPRALPDGTQGPEVGFASDQDLEATGWPDAALTQPPVQPCAVLTPTPGDKPSVQLGIDPRGAASAADLADAAQKKVLVQPGAGAYVWSGDFEDSTSESPFVIDAKADIYPLLDEATIAELGYGGVPMTVVPDTWIELFERGVTLSTSAALCPPDSSGTAVDQSCETYSGSTGAADVAGGAS